VGCLGFLIAIAAVPAAYSQDGADLIVADIPDVQWLGSVGGITAYGVASTACNVGGQAAPWQAITPQHPVTIQNLYRLKDGRFEQIGQSWALHNVAADDDSFCDDCMPSGTSQALGVGCSTENSAYLNGFQLWLGPRSQINAATGEFPVWFGAPPLPPLIGRRLQAHDDDLDPELNAGASYFVEVQYVSAADAASGRGANSASHRRVSVTEGWFESFTIDVTDTTRVHQPAIRAWSSADASVLLAPVDLPGDGRLWVASSLTDLGGGLWRYEYAVENLSSDRSAGSFSIGLPDGANVSNVGFHAVEYHSGEPFPPENWSAEVVAGRLTWATPAYADNPDANALRWGTLYNFRFDVDAAPGSAGAVVGLFKPGNPEARLVPVKGPATGDCNANGTPDATDITSGVSADCNANGAPDECENDCNCNGVPDIDDIDAATSPDEDGNGVPDECALWVGGTGNWSDPAAWGNMVVPNNNESVSYVALLRNNAVVTVDAPVAVGGLAVLDDATVHVIDGDLTITSPVGIFAHSSVFVGPGRAIAAAGAFSLAGNGSLHLTAPDAALASSGPAAVVSNHASLRGHGLLEAALMNAPGGIVKADAPGELLAIVGHPKTNNGLFEAANQGVLCIRRDVDGGGAYRASGGTIELLPDDGPLNVSGLILDIIDAGAVHVSGAAALSLGSTLTVASFGTYQKKPNAAGAVSAALDAGSVVIQPDGAVVLTDAMGLTTGSLMLDGVPTPDGFVGGATPPVMIVTGDAVVTITGDALFQGCASVSYSSTQSVLLGGDFHNQSTCPELFSFQGSLVMDGPPGFGGAPIQTFEVAGSDVGQGVGGFVNNFAMSQLVVDANANVTFEDAFDNNLGGQSPCSEGLYVGRLTLRTGSTVTFDNGRVYFNQLVDEGSGSSLAGCGQLLPTGDGNNDGFIDLADHCSFAACLIGQAPCQPDVSCANFDMDADGSINLADFARFSRVFTGN